jgi:hypothetical protein
MVSRDTLSIFKVDSLNLRLCHVHPHTGPMDIGPNLLNHDCHRWDRIWARSMQCCIIRYLHVEQSDMGRSLIAKIDIPDNTDLSYYIGTANAVGLDPHSNHSMYLGLCGGVPLHVNATRLPGDLPLGACMHLHAHSCNPNGVVYEYIPDGWNNDLALLVFRSIMYIKAGDLVTFAYKGSMWRPYATLPTPPAGFETIRCLCANPCPKDMGRLDWIETVPRLSPQECAKREHGTIEQDGDEQVHGCVYPAGAQRIFPDQDGGETSCFEQGAGSSCDRTIEMSDHTDPDVDGCTAKQLGRGGNGLGGADICESECSGTERHGVGQTGAENCSAGRGDAGECGGANCTRDPAADRAGPLVLQLSSPSRLCKVMEDVYTLPQLLSHSQRARLARLLTSISKQLRLNPLSGMIRYAVPRGRDHYPQERLEIDLSFLYHLRRTSSRLRVSGQCPLIRHCESEARAALSMLDLLMQQFREGLEASGV